MRNNLQIKYISNLPDKDSFYERYNTTGWNIKGRTSEQLSDAVKNSWLVVGGYINVKQEILR